MRPDFLKQLSRGSRACALVAAFGSSPAFAQEQDPSTPPAPLSPDVPDKDDEAEETQGSPTSDSSPQPESEGQSEREAPTDAPDTPPTTAEKEPQTTHDGAPIDSPAALEKDPAEKREEEPSLKARLDSPTSPPESAADTSHLPRSALRAEEARPASLPAPRTEVMPGDFVARPVTLPRGTFKLEFGQGLVLWDAPQESALAPAFSLGVTERLEIGLDAPLHYDPGIDAWAALQPRPHVGVTWADRDGYEIGTRIRAVIPARPSIEPSVALAIPVLWRLGQEARIDVVPEFHTGVGADRALVARLGAQGSWQFSPSVFGAIGGTAQIGFLDSRDSGFDPEILLGFTHQNYGRSFVDFTIRIFAAGVGGGEEGHVSKGAGFAVALIFYPELY